MKSSKNSKDLRKLIHDLNSGISALEQGFLILKDNVSPDSELPYKVIELGIEKIDEVKNDLHDLKELIKNKFSTEYK